MKTYKYIVALMAAFVTLLFAGLTPVSAGEIISPSIGTTVSVDETGNPVLVSKECEISFSCPTVGHDGTFVRLGRAGECGWVHYRHLNAFRYESLAGRRLICDLDSDIPMQIVSCDNLIWIPCQTKTVTRTFVYEQSTPVPYEEQMPVVYTNPQPRDVNITMPAPETSWSMTVEQGAGAATHYDFRPGETFLKTLEGVVRAIAYPLGQALRRPDTNSTSIAANNNSNVASGGEGGAGGKGGNGAAAAAAASTSSSSSTAVTPTSGAGGSNGSGSDSSGAAGG